MVGHISQGVHFVEHDPFNDFLEPGWGDGYLVSEDRLTGMDGQFFYDIYVMM